MFRLETCLATLSCMTVVFSVIFPSNLLFFSSFLRSLESQTNKDFQLVLFNDGVSDLEKYLQNTLLNVQSYEVAEMSPFEIRLAGLQKLLDLGAEYVIFADTDDLLSPERVAVSVDYLHTYPFVCNDICLINRDEATIEDAYWGDRIVNKTVFNIDRIKNYNILGLGNSALQCRALLPMTEKLKGYKSGNDWLLFSTVGADLYAVFVNECKTLYRQHSHNFIGKKRITSDSLLDMINRKLEHYFQLEKMNFKGYDVKEQIDKNQSILIKCKQSHQFLNEQVTKINSLGINFFWWEEPNYIN